jgi:hypothetical protein
MADSSRSRPAHLPKKFLGIRFASCMCYGRLYINSSGDAYVGHCPKCYRPYRIRVGEGGTSSRMFLAYCK